MSLSLGAGLRALHSAPVTAVFTLYSILVKRVAARCSRRTLYYCSMTVWPRGKYRATTDRFDTSYVGEDVQQ